jgi:hypothetical protein
MQNQDKQSSGSQKPASPEVSGHLKNPSLLNARLAIKRVAEHGETLSAACRAERLNASKVLRTIQKHPRLAKELEHARQVAAEVRLEKIDDAIEKASEVVEVGDKLIPGLDPKVLAIVQKHNSMMASRLNPSLYAEKKDNGPSVPMLVFNFGGQSSLMQVSTVHPALQFREQKVIEHGT